MSLTRASVESEILTAADHPFARVLYGRATVDERERVIAGVLAWLRGDADARERGREPMPLERFLGLSAEDLRTQRRDAWIVWTVQAQAHPGKWKRFPTLAEAWNDFLVTGPWRRWRDDSEPPASASAIEVGLFYMSRYNRGQPLGADRIAQIYRSLNASD